MASELGAPTPTRIGAPATAAFCTSSNDSRPLTHRIRSPSGTRPSSSARPIDLVHGVVAPHVLARQMSGSVAVNRPVACRPPVRSNAGLLERVGSSATSGRGDTRGPAGSGALATATSSIAPLPHTPHEEVV